MKRLLALVAMILLVATMLTACGDTIRFSKVVVKNSYKDSTPTFTEAEELAVEGNIEQQKGDLIQLIDTSGENSVCEVYNVVQKKSVWKERNAKNVSFHVHLMEQEGVSWFYAVKATTTENEDGEETTTEHYAIYDASGKMIAEAEGKMVQEPETTYDLIRFDGKVYRISEKGIKEAFKISELKKLPSIDHKAGDYYIGTSSNSVAVYNSKLDPVVIYNFPSYANSSNRSTHVLSNGNVLVQYSVSLGDYAEEYDYIKDGKKYELTSILIKANAGEYETIDLSFVVYYVVYGEELEDEGVDADLDNVALVYNIKNKMLDSSSTGGKLVVLSNKAKVEATIDGYVTGMYPQLIQVAKNRWAIMNSVGSTFLINHKGEVLGEVSKVEDANENYLVSSESKVYDWDLKLVLDMKEYDAADYEMYENCIVMTNLEGETLLLANGEVTTLIAKADNEKKHVESLCDRLFVVCDNVDESKFDIYNDKGEVIFSGEKKLTSNGMEIAFSEDQYLILEVYNENGDRVYMLVK